ncbi:MAG TPA: ImmA/IrrE family metallo-endopeptidase [Bacteroidia bacterium]|nr:ImmA/IrrE family metallo-endopeptidase [Bacteroidia bacterium]HNU34807.1 ImmA/IrrE family metallo-endopeptidase [Bacteroidia bacterium]
MDTVEKGNKFELQSLEIIKHAIETKQIPVVKEYAKVYTKKGYFSNSRQKEIVFDLSIEIWAPNSTNYSFIFFIECKNYSSSIPVNDLEEFESKVNQVSSLNRKAILVSNNNLQESAYNFAKSKGIMYIKGECSEDYEIILHKVDRTTKSSDDLNFANQLSHLSLNERIVVEEINQIISYAFFQDSETTISNYSKDDLKKLSEAELNTIDPEILIKGYALGSKKLINYITSQGIGINTLPSSSNLLGSCDIKNRIISIHPTILRTTRYLFVLAHEFAHLKLHANFKINQESYDNFSDSELNFRTNKYDLKNPKHWIEWQANQYASNLVLPKDSLLARLCLYQKREYLKVGKIFIDDQTINIKIYHSTIKELAYIFDVTMTSVSYRLNDLGMVINKSRLKSVSQILDEIKDELFT